MVQENKGHDWRDCEVSVGTPNKSKQINVSFNVEINNNNLHPYMWHMLSLQHAIYYEQDQGIGRRFPVVNNAHVPKSSPLGLFTYKLIKCNALIGLKYPDGRELTPTRLVPG